MTCIVGLVDKGNVYMGGDSAGVSGYDMTIRADQKVFRNGAFIVGFTSSFRMGQLLRYKFVPPLHHESIDNDRYMCTSFIDAVRQCLKDGGYARNNSGEESAGTFIVGYRGSLFVIHSDYQVSKPMFDYAAVGCGEQIAVGVLFATDKTKPIDRVNMALSAAEQHNAGVRGPFVIEKLETKETDVG